MNSEPQNQRQPNISASLLGRAAQIDKASRTTRENLTLEVSQNKSENLYKERAAVFKKTYEKERAKNYSKPKCLASQFELEILVVKASRCKE